MMQELTKLQTPDTKHTTLTRTLRVEQARVPCIGWEGSPIGGCIYLVANFPPRVPAADQA